MGKNVAVFVDVANIFYAAKAAGVDIDYVTLLKAATAGRDFVRAYAYTGLDPDNENQRNFHQFLARHQYKVVSKDIRKYGDGKVKANLDIELVVDMMKTARNLDIAVIVSGDGDFASAIRAVQEMGVRCEVISFRGNTSSDLIDVADLFTDITQIAKVDKGSTRSGRRVADDEEDLSMTEVPDKITEGTGRGRGRGRGGRGRDRDEVAASSRGGRPSRTPRYDTPRYDDVAASSSGGSGGQLIALPGERLSRAAAVAAPVADGEEPEELDETTGAEVGVVEGGEGAEGEAGRRRRRRRGGRGRGRGRQEGDVLVEGAEPAPGEEAEEAEAVEAVEGVEGEAPAAVAATERAPRPERPARQERPARRTASGDLPTPFDDMDALSTSRARRPATPFGSVWDAQLGTPSRPAASGLTPLPADEEDLDEPEIPEYLLAERRRGGQGQGQGQGGRGGRGGGGGRGGNRSAYNAAIERERYGGSRGMPSSTSGGMSGGGRFAEPSRGGVGRGPQQPSRGGGRIDRPDRVERAPRAGGGEPWSEVPPELEQMLLAQMQRSRADAPAASSGKPQQSPAPNAGTAKAEPGTAEVPARRTTRRAAPAAASTPAVGSEVAPTPIAEAVGTAPVSEAPKRRTTRRPAAEAATPVAPVSAPVPETPAAPAEAPKRRTTRKAAPAAEAPVQAAPAAPEASAAVAAPKRRTTRKPAEATPAPAASAESAPVADAPKRRTTTRKKAEPAEG
ncbi:MAG: LabA-like NYN domain-containing protein [Candidatus Limnocylindrales bacterium]